VDIVKVFIFIKNKVLIFSQDWIQARKAKIFLNLIGVAAETNVAVDNIMEKLISEGVSVIRIGEPGNVHQKFRRYTLAHKLLELQREEVRRKQEKVGGGEARGEEGRD
jgi:hypothetical protein